MRRALRTQGRRNRARAIAGEAGRSDRSRAAPVAHRVDRQSAQAGDGGPPRRALFRPRHLGRGPSLRRLCAGGAQALVGPDCTAAGRSGDARDPQAVQPRFLRRNDGLGSSNARAWSWRAAIHMVQADYAKAREDCLALQKLESELYAVGCTAYLDGTTGKAAAAHRALSAAFAKNADTPPEVKVWVLTRLAEMSLRPGDLKQAEEHFRAAYFEPINDQFLLAAYADFLLDQGRPDEVIPLLVDWVKSSS